MADKKVHFKQAKHNELLSKNLVKGKYYDWSCTTAFYSALHFVEAKFFEIPEVKHGEEHYRENRAIIEKESPNTTTHLYREVLLKQFFPTIRTTYRILRETSEQVRYLPHGKNTWDFLNRNVASKIVSKDLKQIKQVLGF